MHYRIDLLVVINRRMLSEEQRGKITHTQSLNSDNRLFTSWHTGKIHHHVAWLLPPSLPSSPHTFPLALHHLVNWIIVFCHCHYNAYLCNYPDVGDTIIHMPTTMSTDGCVIASTWWLSPYFVIRFIVIFLWVFTVWCFQIRFLHQMPLESHLEWTSVSDNEIQGSSFSSRSGSLSGDILAWQALPSHLFLLSSMVEIRFPLSYVQGEFLTLKWP